MEIYTIIHTAASSTAMKRKGSVDFIWYSSSSFFMLNVWQKLGMDNAEGHLVIAVLNYLEKFFEMASFTVHNLKFIWNSGHNLFYIST